MKKKRVRVRNKLDQKKRYINGAAKLLYSIDYLGRYCKHCGLDGFDDPWFMDFHHRNPKDKEYEVKNKVMHQLFTTVKPELDKCDILCGKCHRRLHTRIDLLTEYKDEITIRYNELKTKEGVTTKLPRIKFSKKESELIYNSISNGLSIKETALLLNKPLESVRGHSKYLGLKTKKPKKLALDNDVIDRMFDEGKSLREIGRHFHTDNCTIKNRLIQSGKIQQNEKLHHNAVVKENKRRRLQ